MEIHKCENYKISVCILNGRNLNKEISIDDES